jgi:transcriptional regulator with XRE-family HTH domain
MTRAYDAESVADYKKDVGKRLRALREVSGLKQRAFASGFGKEQNTYQKWESGGNFPDPMAVLGICKRYGVDFNYVFLGDFDGLGGNLAAKLAQKLSSTAPRTEEED